LLKKLIAAVPLLALAVAPVSATAPEHGNKELQRYCSGDAATFCGDVDPSSPKMNACFKANMSQLSENCRCAITAYKRGGR
jgi:hypothetical protein